MNEQTSVANQDYEREGDSFFGGRVEEGRQMSPSASSPPTSMSCYSSIFWNFIYSFHQDLNAQKYHKINKWCNLGPVYMFTCLQQNTSEIPCDKLHKYYRNKYNAFTLVI